MRYRYLVNLYSIGFQLRRMLSTISWLEDLKNKRVSMATRAIYKFCSQDGDLLISVFSYLSKRFIERDITQSWQNGINKIPKWSRRIWLNTKAKSVVVMINNNIHITHDICIVILKKFVASLFYLLLDKTRCK